MGTNEKLLRSVLADVGVIVAYLFGSRASGRSLPTSDADVAVLLDGGMELLDRERLSNQLAETLGVPEVDLVILDEASLELRGRVVQEGRKIFCRDEARRVAFEVRTRSEYFDFLPPSKVIRGSSSVASPIGDSVVDPSPSRRGRGGRTIWPLNHGAKRGRVLRRMASAVVTLGQRARGSSRWLPRSRRQ